MVDKKFARGQKKSLISIQDQLGKESESDENLKILIEFEDRWAVILITFLTIVGWIVSFSLIYTTYYLSTGQDPLSWTTGWMPPWLYDIAAFIGKNGGYFSVIGGTVVSTIIAVIIWRGHKGKSQNSQTQPSR